MHRSGDVPCSRRLFHPFLPPETHPSRPLQHLLLPLGLNERHHMPLMIITKHLYCIQNLNNDNTLNTPPTAPTAVYFQQRLYWSLSLSTHFMATVSRLTDANGSQLSAAAVTLPQWEPLTCPRTHLTLKVFFIVSFHSAPPSFSAFKAFKRKHQLCGSALLHSSQLKIYI